MNKRMIFCNADMPVAGQTAVNEWQPLDEIADTAVPAPSETRPSNGRMTANDSEWQVIAPPAILLGGAQ